MSPDRLLIGPDDIRDTKSQGNLWEPDRPEIKANIETISTYFVEQAARKLIVEVFNGHKLVLLVTLLIFILQRFSLIIYAHSMKVWNVAEFTVIRSFTLSISRHSCFWSSNWPSFQWQRPFRHSHLIVT